MKEHAHHYSAKLTWTAGPGGGTTNYRTYSRNHKVNLPGKPDLALSADPAFRGDPALLNPEDCLLVALSSCHMLSYLALAALKGVEVLAYEDEAVGTMLQTGEGGRFTEVVLRPVVTLSAASDKVLAESLHSRANEICFIANSVNFPVKHEAKFRRQEDA
ncbi:MAG TPA: OsmC family protein [Kiloniellaceae bacterium]|nr:OsmC family protein [Kiloniellaceae bacterium]